MENNLLWLFWIGGEFLLGGVMFSQLVPKLLGKGDVGRDSDDHNPGAANVFCLCGVPLGVLCLLLDLLKGFVPVFLAKGLSGSPVAALRRGDCGAGAGPCGGGV